MPTFEVSRGALTKSSAEVLAIPAASSPDADGGRSRPVLGADAEELGGALGIDLAAELDGLEFEGSVGALARIPTRGRVPARTVLVVGVGPADEVDADRLRRAGAAVANVTTRAASVATTLPSVGDLDPADAAQAVVEGITLGTYRFGTYKSEQDDHALDTVTFHPAGDASSAGWKAGIEPGLVAASAAMLARDLVNLPAGDKRPPALAERVATEFANTDVTVRVLEEDELEAGGYGGLLGVGAGSTAPPRLVELTYAPDGARGHIALVGKGITFDSGGLSLKPSASMETMKMDMGGAATVLATVKAAAELRLPVKLTGLLALAENMPSGSAIRPGNVLRTHGGTTIEVLNTDAEGRLVLADALAHASELSPDLIVDMATLTGAATVALGPRIGALMSTDDDVAEALLAAGQRAGEPFWRLPLATEQYGEDLKGDVGDVKNSGWKGAGTIRAGLFLHTFVGDGIPWAHLDIAGVAWSDERRGYLAKGATGVPVRTLVEWLRQR